MAVACLLIGLIAGVATVTQLFLCSVTHLCSLCRLATYRVDLFVAQAETACPGYDSRLSHAV